MVVREGDRDGDRGDRAQGGVDNVAKVCPFRKRVGNIGRGVVAWLAVVKWVGGVCGSYGVETGVYSVIESNSTRRVDGTGDENVRVVDDTTLLFGGEPKVRGVWVNGWPVTDTGVPNGRGSASGIDSAHEVELLEKRDDDGDKRDKMSAVVERVDQEEGAILYFKNEVQFDMVVW